MLKQRYAFVGNTVFKGCRVRGGIAHLVGCWTKTKQKKAGAILTWVRFPSKTKDFSPCELSVLTLTVFVQPLCVITQTNICVHVRKSQTIEHTKILHTQVGMGSTALAAAVALPR